MRNRPLVSVIMPAYNAARFIAEAIISVQSQSYTNWELLIIDDASSDNTAAVVAGFLSDARIRYKKTERIGKPAGVRNVGLRMAEGEYITFLDADDRYVEHALATLSGHLDVHPGCNAVYGFYHDMNEAGELLPLRHPFMNLDKLGNYKIYPAYKHTWRNILNSHTVHRLSCLMIRRKIFAKISGFNEQLILGEDFIFYIQLFAESFNAVHYIDKVIYHYRVYEDSICNQKSRFLEILENLEKTAQFFALDLPLPVEAKVYQSEFIARTFGYYAHTRYDQGETQQLHDCVKRAWQNPYITKQDWARFCLPILLRTFLPKAAINSLKPCKNHLKVLIYKSSQITQ